MRSVCQDFSYFSIRFLKILGISATLAFWSFQRAFRNSQIPKGAKPEKWYMCFTLENVLEHWHISFFQIHFSYLLRENRKPETYVFTHSAPYSKPSKEKPTTAMWLKSSRLKKDIGVPRWNEWNEWNYVSPVN